MNHHYSKKKRDRLLVQGCESTQLELVTSKRPARPTRSFPPTQNFFTISIAICFSNVNRARPASSRRSLMRQPPPLPERRSPSLDEVRAPFGPWLDETRVAKEIAKHFSRFVIYSSKIWKFPTPKRPSAVQKKNSEKHAISLKDSFLFANLHLSSHSLRRPDNPIQAGSRR